MESRKLWWFDGSDCNDTDSNNGDSRSPWAEDRVGTILGSLCVLIHLTLTRAPRRGRYYHYSDVINEKTETRKR